MSQKKSAPACKKAEGAECLLGGDTSANSIAGLRAQFLSRHGITRNRANLFGLLLFGETRHG